MPISRADRRLGIAAGQFLRAHLGMANPRLVLLAWEGDADPGGNDMLVITNADDPDAVAALDAASREIDDPSP